MALTRSRARLVGVARVSRLLILVFVFMFGKVLKEVRSVLMETECGWTVDYDENQFVQARARRHARN